MKKMAEKGPQNASRRLGAPPSDGWKATPEAIERIFLYKKYKDEANAFRPPLSKLIDHLDYIVQLIGVDHVGIGSDFDGITSSPLGLDEVTDLPLITKALLERGYSKKNIEKIIGGNFIHVFKANMK